MSSKNSPFRRLSKQEKRAQKAQHARDTKVLRRLRDKERKSTRASLKTAARTAHLLSMSAEEQALFLAQELEERERNRLNQLQQAAAVDSAYHSGLRVVLDLSYSEKMSDKEQASLARQIMICWGSNRKAIKPVALHLAGLASCSTACLPPSEHTASWRVHRIDEDVTDAFPRDDLVFLSPDAEEPLTSLDPQCVYVVGGLVDSNVQKQTSLEKARANGARAVRLPLAEHAPLAASKRLPLTLTSVLEILAAVNNGTSWPAALHAAVAPRLQRPRTGENSRRARRAESRAQFAATWGPRSTASPPSWRVDEARRSLKAWQRWRALTMG